MQVNAFGIKEEEAAYSFALHYLESTFFHGSTCSPRLNMISSSL